MEVTGANQFLGEYYRKLLCKFEKHQVEGINITVFHTSIGRRIKFIKSFNNFLFKNKLRKVLKENDIQIVYCFYELEIVKILLDLRNELQTFKVVMRMAGMKWYEDSKNSSKNRKQYYNVFNQIDSVNFISSGLKMLVNKKIEELNMDVKFQHIFVGDIGSSFNSGRKLSYQDVQDETFDLLMATRFSSYQKRQDILLEAVNIIGNQIPLKLTFIGSGPNSSKIEKAIENYALKDIVSISPFLPQEKLWDLMMRSDLLCHTVEYEGLGKIIIESMAMGLPVLASNVLPLNKYIIDGENGFLINNDPEEWAHKIKELYRNKEELINVSNASMKFINRKYDPNKNIKLYESNFEKLAGMQ